MHMPCLWLLTSFVCGFIACKKQFSLAANAAQNQLAPGCVILDAAKCCVIESEIVDSGVTSAIAEKLDMPLVQSATCVPTDYTHALCVMPYEYNTLQSYALAITAVNSINNINRSNKGNVGSKKGRQKKVFSMTPVSVDFYPTASSLLAQRMAKQRSTDLLVKAISPRRGYEQGAVIWDATAGFGKDALLMAMAGAKHVHMIERDPIIACLLSDALRRLRLLASLDSDAASLSDRLSLEIGDGVKSLERVQQCRDEHRPNIVYLDPMFPPRTKRASVKKGMQILHDLLDTQSVIGPDGALLSSNDGLFEVAYSAALSKVVVKRPVNADRLVNEEVAVPNASIIGGTHRWDVYTKG
jgi:16S rRNA (guanine1516-N2)-methyltransferase